VITRSTRITRAARRLSGALVAGSALWGWPGGARAFSDAATFAAPVLEAGGGGRYYTGSLAEGYGCDTCHRGGTAPLVTVAGLPARYVPRATYELRVSWPRELEHAAAVLEVTDERGRGVGMLALPAPDAYLAEEVCEPQELEQLAAQLYAADRERTVAATPDCGASLLRMQWTAPAERVGAVWVAGSVVSVNHDGNFTGDGARSFVRTIPEFGSSVPDVVTQGGCSMIAPAAGGGASRGGLLVLMLWSLRRAQRVLRRLRQPSTKRCRS
jgi:hypothetical protein